MKPIAVNREGNTVRILWEDGREQVTHIVGFWDYFQQNLDKILRR